MKSNREFLDGVYTKAEALKTEPQKIQKFSLTKKYTGIAVAAAVLLVAISPSLFFNSSTPMYVPDEAMLHSPYAIRIQSETSDLSQIVNEADVVVTAKVTKINKSVYEKDNNNMTTTVELKAENIYKGELNNESFQVCVMGGYDKKTNTYFPYEATFEKDEDTLLFLTKSTNSSTPTAASSAYSLSLSSQSKYTYVEGETENRVYTNSDENIITIVELEQVASKLADVQPNQENNN